MVRIIVSLTRATAIRTYRSQSRSERRGGRARRALFTFAVRIDRVVDTLRCAVLIPQNEIGMRDALRRQILRQGRALARGKRPRRGVASSLGAHWSLKLLG
jgi:hypothetical protein